MSKSITVAAVVLAALVAVALAQTRCLPQVRAVHEVKTYFNETYEVCNKTVGELKDLAGTFIVRLFTDLPENCTASLHDDMVKCKDVSKEKTKPMRSKSNSKKKSKSRSGSKSGSKSRGDKFEFEVAITCSGAGSDPCLLANDCANSLPSIERSLRSILQSFRPQPMQSFTVDDMMVDVRIKRNRGLDRFCEVPSSLRPGPGRRGKGTKRRSRTCGEFVYNPSLLL